MDAILINITNENINEVDQQQQHIIEEMSKERSNDSFYSKDPVRFGHTSMRLRSYSGRMINYSGGMLNTVNLANVEKELAKIKKEEIMQKHDLIK